jgi:ribosome biogenesis GTPase A
VSSKLERPVQWYPGHMAKAVRHIREYLRAIDVVVEVVDARIARIGRNPLLDELAGARTRFVVLDRSDLADPAVTRRWLRCLSGGELAAIAVDGRNQRSVGRIAAALGRTPRKERGTTRAMIVGIPNAGKSTIVNALLRRAAAKTEARAGVTKHVQWFRLAQNVELMDTPGVLPPRVPSVDGQWKLALCGAVPAERYDAQEVAAAFHHWLQARAPRTSVPDLHAFATARGFRRHGGETEYHNAARAYIKAFNEGAFGRISLEAPDDAEAA